jgi:tetratricopeptide (TPR) repeat protein
VVVSGKAQNPIVKLVVRAILAGILTFAAVIPQALAPTMARAQDDERRVSLRLYNEAADDYRAGRFDDAADKLETAHRLFPEPILLYNLGRALDGGGDLEGALDAYHEFLGEADEDADERSVALARIQVVEGLLASRDEEDELERERELANIQVVEAPPEGPPGYTLSIALAASAVVSAGVGLALQLRAGSLGDDAADPVTSQEQAQELNAQARRNAIGGIVMLAAGSVLAALSAALFIVRKNERTEVSLSPTGASVRVRF